MESLKVTKRENYRVVLEPSTAYMRIAREGESQQSCDERLHKREADDLAKEAKRHLDCESITVECDVVEVCRYCGSTWEKSFDTEGPMCCDAAINEWTAANPPK